jgi:tetratricopeptide (TPR) repeat protein
MTTFQLFLLIVAGAVFYLFFKQLFSGSYPKRGVDFEAKIPDEQIGGISRPDKTFSKPSVQPTRMEELLQMADDAVKKGDMLEARKAIQSALIIDGNNIEALRRNGYLQIEFENYEEARESYEKILSLDENDDVAHDSLANVLHKLGKDEEAIVHHKRAIELDPEYAPHYYNYANTLYDLGQQEEALKNYKKAYELDSSLEEAKEMIVKLGGSHE